MAAPQVFRWTRRVRFIILLWGLVLGSVSLGLGFKYLDEDSVGSVLFFVNAVLVLIGGVRLSAMGVFIKHDRVVIRNPIRSWVLPLEDVSLFELRAKGRFYQMAYAVLGDGRALPIRAFQSPRASTSGRRDDPERVVLELNALLRARSRSEGHQP